MLVLQFEICTHRDQSGPDPHPFRRGERQQQSAYAVDSHGEEMADEAERPRVQTGEERDGPTRADPSKAQIVEACLPHLVPRFVR